MKQFMALLRLQLLSRYADMKPRNLKTALKEKKGRTIGMFFLILFLIVYMGGMLFFAETKIIDALMKMHMADMLVTMAVVFATAGTLVMAFFFVLSVLFLGRDATYLASLPVKARTLLSAKLTQVWISETCIDALIILPACILYGIKTGAAAIFYCRMIVVWLLIASLPICLIAILSSLLIRLSALWKHREMLMTVGGIAFLPIYWFTLIGAMACGLTVGLTAALLSPLLGWLIFGAPAADMLPDMLLKGTLLSLCASFICHRIGRNIPAAALSVAAAWLLAALAECRKLSMLQSETPSGRKKKFTGKESFAAAGQLKACVLREIKTIFRVPSYATNILPVSFMPVIMIIMMNMFMSKMGEGANGFGGILAELNPALVMCILAAIMAYMGGLSPALSTAVTREGSRAKFITGFSLSFIGHIAAGVAMVIFFPGMELQVALALIMCLLFLYVNSCLELSRDIKKPKLDWVTEQEAVKQNFGVLIGMFISWAILIALAALSYFLITWKLNMWIIFGILSGILVILCIVTRTLMYRNADKYYCET